MNHGHIRSRLEAEGLDAELTADRSTLFLTFKVGEKQVKLVHVFPDELLRTPKFLLANGHDGQLAHVGVDHDAGLGVVCIDDPGSTAINTDCPDQVYVETVQEHINLLTRLIDEPEHNRAELLREFDAHWAILCRKPAGGHHELFVEWDGHGVETLQVKPPQANQGSDLRKRHIAFASARPPESVWDIAELETRQNVGMALGVPLDDVDPPPAAREELLAWYFSTTRQVDRMGHREWRLLKRKGRRNYWIVLSAEIPDGETMFAIHWSSSARGPLPSSEEDAGAGQWTLTPYRVRSLSPASLVPRGGGSVGLREKSVLLVGCGSIGSELALMLTSAGLGQLTISDPDTFSEENLYRHVLSVKDIGQLKSEALASEIALRHPWAEVRSCRRRLEELRDPAVLQPFDLVVVAIGSPTVERVFAEYCRKEELHVPVMNSWLEAYGIGGHAVLAVPPQRGCWHCAYVDPNTLGRGLTSNLNFLQPGEVVMRNHGGCGTQFMPYSGIAAGCTATMAADLAVRFLVGEVATSSKVSWKRDDGLPTPDTLKMTRRYQCFAKSLRILPLYDENCDLCSG